MTSPPDVSIVIVTWNGREHLDACLTAVAAQEGITAETILVDNGSTDGTVEHVRARYPWVKVVPLSENRGFAAGTNTGAREARGRFVALLNNDTVPDKRWLRTLLDGVDESGPFLLATSLVVYMHDPQLVDSAGDGLLLAGGAFKRYHGERLDGPLQPAEVFGVCGAACLMPRRVFEELRGFDEDFFASHEDVDLSYRARLLGYRCRFVPAAVVLHRGSATIGRTSAFSVFHGQRNLEWVFLKNTPGALLLRTLPAHLLYTAAAALHFARMGRLGPFLRAKAAAIGGLGRILRKRAEVQRTRRVGADAIVPLMERGWLTRKRREKRFDARLAGSGR